MALNLTLPICKKEAKSSLLSEVCKQWPGCVEEILVGNGLAPMTSEMHSMVLGREGRIVVEDWAEFRGR